MPNYDGIEEISNYKEIKVAVKVKIVRLDPSSFMNIWFRRTDAASMNIIFFKIEDW